MANVYANNVENPSIQIKSNTTLDTLGLANFSIVAYQTKGFTALNPKLETSQFSLQNNSWHAINDSIQESSLGLVYDAQNLPYYPEKITINIPFAHSETKDTLYLKEIFYVYFAPYGETEIWNSLDFHNLPRAWYTPVAGQNPAGTYIAKNSFAASDLDALNYWQQALAYFS